MKKVFGIWILSLMVSFTISIPPSSFSAEFVPEKTTQNAVPDINSRAAETNEKKGRSIEDITEGALKMEGLFTLYLKEDKLYLELLPEHFLKKYLFIPTQWTSVGRGGAGRYFPERVFFWEKRDNKVLLIWKNTRLKADKSPHAQRALKNVLPNSIAFSFKIEAESDTRKGTLLITADDFFFSDLQNLASFGDSRHPYRVDKSRTVWGKIMAFPENVELEVRYTLASSQPMSVPTVPDPGVFTLNVRYSISELPVNNGYIPRLADERVGYFSTRVYDYDKNDIDGTETFYINRWHLEKKNSGAAVSEPKKPIVFWLENTIPPEFRKPMRDGILEWNKAFEKAGYKNALVVKQMPDDADWDSADIRYSTVRWIPSLTGAGGGGMGPSRVNPMTGQILGADIMIRAPLNFIFSYHAYNKPLELDFAEDGSLLLAGKVSPWEHDNYFLGMERDFGILDMLASGKIEDIDEVPKEYIYAAVKNLVCHEIGHALGLRHNFKGSSTITLKDLHNTAVTSKESIGNSIMEYLPVNLAPIGVEQGDYFATTLGAWDYWVIKYGYVHIDVKNPEDEQAVLGKIALRASEPELVYGTDEDAYDMGPYASSIDPLCVTFDLSSDPLAYAEQQINRIEAIWDQLEDRILFQGRSYHYLRRAFESSLSRYFQFIERLVKWIGGVHHSRVYVGTAGSELPFRVADYKQQQRALDLIKKSLLSPKVFNFSPAFLNKLQIKNLGRLDAAGDISQSIRRDAYSIDFSLSSHLKGFYHRILASLYDPMRLRRIQENILKTTGPALKLDNYFSDLFAAIWEELEKGAPVGVYRRILQKEYISRITEMIHNPGTPLPYDAVVIGRFQLKLLNQKISIYLTDNPKADLMTRAHLQHCTDIIEEALKKTHIKTINDE